MNVNSVVVGALGSMPPNSDPSQVQHVYIMIGNCIIHEFLSRMEPTTGTRGSIANIIRFKSESQ